MIVPDEPAVPGLAQQGSPQQHRLEPGTAGLREHQRKNGGAEELQVESFECQAAAQRRRCERRRAPGTWISPRRSGGSIRRGRARAGFGGRTEPLAQRWRGRGLGAGNDGGLAAGQVVRGIDLRPGMPR